ncbi:ABC transporter ATP-binding protein [Gemmata sp.]|uniref:ABC transporter ATP-binding protein n=1 Tax=Gemmata sp. TaxID=1914242 RepID=UPI003F709BD9
MSDVVVRVEGLGKEYRLGGRPAYNTLGEQLRNWSPLRGLLGRGRAEAPPPFWALKDVSFEVKPGEVVGIIGRNGAGKSTLLKILSRITEPTEGTADIHGRVGSLLEVGTGFHPELTGRENVYLNGAILGMRRSEVRAKFDDIVGFAEVEKFIDTPVKHYSSGMYTRLAFAVAAHLEPEILIVDEVLAVGDAQFQQKCLGKMGEVARGGRTVLFVSHNMQAVATLCDRGVHLKQGRVLRVGTAREVVGDYLAAADDEAAVRWEGDEGDEDVRLLETSVSGAADGSFRTDEPLRIRVRYQLRRSILGFICAVEIHNQFQQRLVYTAVDDVQTPPPTESPAGEYCWELVIPPDIFAAGRYTVVFDLGIHNVRRVIQDQGRLLFALENVSGLGRRYQHHTDVLRPDWQWVPLPLAGEPGTPTSDSHSGSRPVATVRAVVPR